MWIDFLRTKKRLSSLGCYQSKRTADGTYLYRRNAGNLKTHGSNPLLHYRSDVHWLNHCWFDGIVSPKPNHVIWIHVLHLCRHNLPTHFILHPVISWLSANRSFLMFLQPVLKHALVSWTVLLSNFYVNLTSYTTPSLRKTDQCSHFNIRQFRFI